MPAVKELKHTGSNVQLQKLLAKNDSFLKGLGKNPMYDAVIDAIDGRKIRIGEKWLIDWASCNYLGFDLDPEIMAAIPEYISKWGTHPSWSRMLGSPRLYEVLEDELTDLFGVESSLVFPNLTLISRYCIFILSEGGEIFLDKLSHTTLYEGTKVAEGFGAKKTGFRSDELDHLELLLKMSKAQKKLICVDGVFSMHGKYADIPKLAALARKYDALLYIDDAHGMGIVGERGEDETSPYGKRGNCIVKHFGESYDNIVMITALSKAYSSYSAVLTCSKDLKRHLKATVSPYLYSGPAPIASLATAITGLQVNKKRGDLIRGDLYRKSKKLNDAINAMGFRNDNTTDFPIFNIYLEDPSTLDFVTDFLWKNNTYVTLCPYPMVARKDVGFRIQVTASNTDEEVDYLISVLKKLQDLVKIQKVQS